MDSQKNILTVTLSCTLYSSDYSYALKIYYLKCNIPLNLSYLIKNKLGFFNISKVFQTKYTNPIYYFFLHEKLSQKK